MGYSNVDLLLFKLIICNLSLTKKKKIIKIYHIGAYIYFYFYCP